MSSKTSSRQTWMLRGILLSCITQLAIGPYCEPAAAAKTQKHPVLMNKSIALPHQLPIKEVAQSLSESSDANHMAQETASEPAKSTTAAAEVPAVSAAPADPGAAQASTDAPAAVPTATAVERAAGTVPAAVVAAPETVAAPVATPESSAPTGIALRGTTAAQTVGENQAAGETFNQSATGVKLAPDSVLGFLNPQFSSTKGAPIVIDNDEQQETAATIEYKDLPTVEGGTKVKTGAQFPVVVTSEISSKTAKLNDPIQARLKYDLKIGERLVAPKGSPVAGHINYVLKARTTLHSLVSPERWYRNSGALGISFDDITNEKGEHLPLVAMPARTARVVKNKGEGRELGINHNGQVTGPWSQQLKYKAVRIGLNAALAPAGAFSFGAMPVALGIMGAACPSFAMMKPVGLNVRHRRLKGFAWGFLSGIPGSWLIEDTTVKGQEAVIKPGDEFLVEFQQEFTGEPATDAQLMPNASAKVRGQILSGDKRGKKKSKKADKAEEQQQPAN